MDRQTLEAPETVRLDIWLWRARFFKTRTKARLFIRMGRVRVRRGNQTLRISKSHFALAVSDGVVFAKGSQLFQLEVRALGTRRGPAPEARALYDDLTDTSQLSA